MQRLSTDSTLYYHLIARGRNRESVFEWDEDRWFYLNRLRVVSQRIGVDIHAWVLMSNHVHLLVGVDAPALVSRLLQSCNGLYARHFNWLRQRTGSVWQENPVRIPILFEDYFVSAQQYIELNPLKAGLVERPEEHEWSSCRFHSQGQKDGITTESPWYLSLGENASNRQQTYVAMLRAQIDKDWSRYRLLKTV